MRQILRPALSLFVALSVLTGLIYPLLMTGAAQALFPRQAGGSLIERDGKPVGSRLIGQNFSGAKYFWGRLSATSPMPNNGAGSGGSNLAATNPALVDQAKGRIEALRAADPGWTGPVPADLATASGSGLDPDIRPESALLQVARVAHARGLDAARVRALVADHTERPLIGLIGEPRINVLELNLALDAMKP
ncbi:MAG TPA: potassium-transporting ATPase subunit KdpC [Burkholderiaceae bacterium]|jgi:K+-transporting ATPase ATPase C chain|nr:potassium-transporting ATPase subunit KdpC [Burkholderiaceae bacterium]